MLAARYVLQRELERELPGLAADDGTPDRLNELISEAASLGVAPVLDGERTAPLLEQALLARMARLADRGTADGVEGVLAVLQLGARLGCSPDLWTVQNRFFDFWRGESPEGRAVLARLAGALGFGREPMSG